MRIAVSGLSGCGNTTAARNIGSALNLKVVNYTFRDIARDFGTTFEKVQAKAEESSFKIDYFLDKKLVGLFEKEGNAVICSRLACWLVDADLKVWLEASVNERARRIAQREARDYGQVLEETKKRDKANLTRYKKAYGIDISKHGEVDLIINTENLSPEQVSALIVAAAKIEPMNGRRKMQSKIQKLLTGMQGISEHEMKQLLQ